MAVDKVANPAAAASAYSNTLKTPLAGGGGGDEATFGDVLKSTIRSTIDTIRGGEKASAAAVKGEADLNDVVQAITSAEVTLQTVVSIRDRAISAYQQIMRMPI